MKLFRFFIYISCVALIVGGCAKVGSVYGGPKDDAPPKVVKTNPPENTVNFVPQKKIVIGFDEYIVLENIFQELIISPPLDGNILAQVTGKNISVEFPKEAVFDTTTYTLGFGNSIRDNNEGNILTNYEYVFSLKDFIDTMNIAGQITNAFNHQPDKDRMFIMLYSNLADSAPLLEKPHYLCKTDAGGNFSAHNLEAGTYRIFALKDMNANLLFDLPEEQIGFGDSLITLTPEKFSEDLVINDSLLVEQVLASDSVLKDTTAIDSIIKKERAYTFHTELLFFTQEINNQYLSNNLRPRPEQLIFSFKEPLKDRLKVNPLNYNPQSDWYFLDSGLTNDSLIFWLKDTAMISLDTIEMEISFPVYDSTGNLYYTSDTLNMITQDKALTMRGNKGREREPRKDNKESKPEIKRISLQHNIKNSSAFDLNENIEISTATPVFIINEDRIKLFRMQDTIPVRVPIQITRDSDSFYSYIITYKPEELTSYNLLIADSTITDIYGLTHDTLKVNFKTQAEDFYGTLNMRISGVRNPIILQLMDDKETILTERKLNTDEIVRFEFLSPRNYKMKIIMDVNGNQKWDTGNYLMKLQPEKVIYYPQPIDIRSNWEMDITWQL